MGDGWVMDGRAAKVEKNHVFSTFLKNYSIFFLVVSRPLRRVFKTFSEKNSKKIKIFKFVKKFRTTFFQQFLQFFEVCSSGYLVNFSGVCSRGVLEEVSIFKRFVFF